MQSENPANGAVLVIAQTASLMCQMLLAQHPGAMQETLPVGLPLTLTQSLDTDVTGDGLGLREGLFVRNWSPSRRI